MTDCKDQANESRLKRLKLVITYAPTENCKEKEYIQYLQELKEALNLRSLKVK